jgi:SPX domain protein involved in polyphosphate accumulation
MLQHSFLMRTRPLFDCLLLLQLINALVEEGDKAATGAASPFAVAFDEECLKIQNYYSTKEVEIKRQWHELLDALARIDTTAPLRKVDSSASLSKVSSSASLSKLSTAASPVTVGIADIDRMLVVLVTAMSNLRQYVTLCYFGAQKIVKKHDKNMPVALTPLLLPRLHAQPFFLSRGLARVHVQLGMLRAEVHSLASAQPISPDAFQVRCE